jgi:hypothetical protein
MRWPLELKRRREGMELMEWVCVIKRTVSTQGGKRAAMRGGARLHE